MSLRARIRPFPHRAAFAAASVALFASAVAGAAAPAAHAAKTKKKAPVITSVAPMDVAVGERLTIRGRHFRPGRGRNTVVFKRAGSRAVFTKADISTRKMLRLEVPESLLEYFVVNAGQPVPTRFPVRVLAKKFGKRFTSRRLSPLVFAPRPPMTEVLGDGDCDGDGVLNRDQADDDSDLLSDATEAAIGTDPCKADSDGDGSRTAMSTSRPPI